MSECNMEIMETWRRVLVDWINAVNGNEVPLIYNYPMDDGALFFHLLKTLTTTIQGLDVITRQRLMKFIQMHQTKCAAGEMFVGDNVEGTYLTSLLLVNSSLSEGLHHFLCFNLDPVTKNYVDMYLSSMLSIRDRISKEIIEMVMTHSNQTSAKNNQSNPMDLSQRQFKECETFAAKNYPKIDTENKLLSDKLKNCELEMTNMVEHSKKLQEQLQQSSNEIELLKNKCETLENKNHKAYQYISTYASSIDSINAMIKKLVFERNALRCRVNDLREKLQNYMNKISSYEVETALPDNNNNENSNNNYLSKENNNEVKNTHSMDKKGLQILQVRLERLDQTIIDNASNRNNNKSTNENIQVSECVAPMKAKRERIHGRECWKIVPYTLPQKNIHSNVKKCNKSNIHLSNNCNANKDNGINCDNNNNENDKL